jgi:GR25 family glycosyltransferase involved in LPS biosynthesis
MKKENIPTRLLDTNNFDLSRINYSLINPISENDFDINYTLIQAPEVIGGFWFLGSKNVLLSYQQLYMETFLEFQNNNIADDDQHLVLQCYKKKPELFNFFNKPLGWHKVMKACQKKPLKLISFCLWGNEPRYNTGLIRNILLARLYYPDWKCIVFIHKLSVDENLIAQLKSYNNVIVVLRYDPFVRAKRFMLWRLEPLILYPQVEYLMSRDTDTRIQPREVLAVEEWLDSNKSLHIMRDHPQHYPRILGGMYGIKCEKYFKENLIDDIEGFYKCNGDFTDDQYYLLKSIYEKTESSDRIIHDEIKRYEGDECKSFPIPYEQNYQFVGCYIYEDESTDPQTENVLKNYLQTHLPHRISKDKFSLQEKLYFLSSNINTVYILHYTKLVDRKKHMLKQLKKIMFDKFFNIRWIDNFDRENISPETIQNECVIDMRVLKRRLTLGEIANAMGHKYIYQQILHNDNIALVLEDDTSFKNNFIDNLTFVLNNLPYDWESICLGGPTKHNTVPEPSLPNATKLDFESDEIIFYRPNTKAPCTLSAMLYNKNGVQKILNSQYIQKICAPSDHNNWVCNIDMGVNIYWVQPWITYESSKDGTFDTSLDRGF